jgi:hypothetical protein
VLRLDCCTFGRCKKGYLPKCQKTRMETCASWTAVLPQVLRALFSVRRSQRSLE